MEWFNGYNKQHVENLLGFTSELLPYFPLPIFPSSFFLSLSFLTFCLPLNSFRSIFFLVNSTFLETKRPVLNFLSVMIYSKQVKSIRITTNYKVATAQDKTQTYTDRLTCVTVNKYTEVEQEQICIHI